MNNEAKKNVASDKNMQLKSASNFRRPNIWRRTMHRVQNVNGMISELNSICNIEYGMNEGDSVIAFTPQLPRNIARTKFSTICMRNYVVDTLQKIRLTPYIDTNDDKTNYPDCTAYVSLDNKDNLQRIQEIGYLLRFYNGAKLSQRLLDLFAQNTK